MEILTNIEQEGIKILYRPLSDGLRGSVFQKGKKWYIVVNKSDPQERQNFTVAHEYSEILLYDRPYLDSDEKHKLANSMASELLLPEKRFKPAAVTKNLHELKETFPEVSYEVIARRLPLFRRSAVSILDNMHVTGRFGSPDLQYPEFISEAEYRAAETTLASKETALVDEPPMTITGYYVPGMMNYVRIYVVADIDD